MDFIKCLIGKDATKCINKRAQNIFFETCREFEIAKRTIKPQSDIKFRVRIPFELGGTYAKVYPGENLRSKETVLTKKDISLLFHSSGTNWKWLRRMRKNSLKNV